MTPTSQILGMTGNTLEAFYYDVQGEFQKQFEIGLVGNVHSQISTMKRVSGKAIRQPYAHLISAPREWKGERQYENIASGYFDAEWYAYEHTIKVDEYDFEDDSTGTFRDAVGQQGALMAKQYDELLAEMLNTHIAGAATVRWPAGFDAKDYFATDHAWGWGYTTSQSNILSGSNAGKLDATYGEANLKTAYNNLFQFKGPDGRIIGTRPTHLICSSSVVWAAREFLQSPQWVSGNTTRHGSTNVLTQMGLQVIEYPQLTSGYWIMADLSGPIKPWWTFERQGVVQESLLQGWDKFSKRALYFGVSLRMNCAPGAWWRAIAGDGT